MTQGRILSSWTSVLVTALVAQSVRADTPRCDGDAVCKSLGQQARTAFRKKDWARAIDLYEQAHRRVPEPELLLNIGRCHHKLGQCDRAQEQYRLYRAQAPLSKPDVTETLSRFETDAAACQTVLAPTPTTPIASVSESAATSGSILKKWWFWTLLGTAAAGTAVGLGVGLTRQAPSPGDPPNRYYTFSITFEPKR
jgi:tetratricopeptide (TPR) repeat protein